MSRMQPEVRGIVRSAYQQAYARTEDSAAALAAAAVCFTQHMGHAPERDVIEALLRGVMLGDDHPLMQLLNQPLPARRASDHA